MPGQRILIHQTRADQPDSCGATIFTKRASYRHVITANSCALALAGFGKQFNLTAGPIGDNIDGITGVSQGILVSRLAGEEARVDLEIAILRLVRDVHVLYWQLSSSTKAESQFIEPHGFNPIQIVSSSSSSAVCLDLCLNNPRRHFWSAQFAGLQVACS